MKTLKEFVKEHVITMTLKRADSNPNMDTDKPMKHYKVALHRMTRSPSCKMVNCIMTTPFSTGMGWKKDPEVEDVLDCLASDTHAIEYGSTFEDWCADLGYDADSRKAEKIYKTCQKQSAKLLKFLGQDLYKELLNNVESL